MRGALELYFEHLADFGALYGSLGALMALLIFVYAVSLVLVFGAEYASEWSRLPDEDVSVRPSSKKFAQVSRARADEGVEPARPSPRAGSPPLNNTPALRPRPLPSGAVRR